MRIAAPLAAKHLHHQSVEQVLCRVGRRELVLMMLIEHVIFHFQIEFKNTTAVGRNHYAHGGISPQSERRQFT